MPPEVIPIWKVIGSLFLPFLAILALIWFVCAMGGLGGVVAHGAKHLPEFGANFLTRTSALAAAFALVLIAGLIFKTIGAPIINGFFPAFASTAPTITAPTVPAPPSASAPGTP